jgi:hypothetical protein
VTALEQALIRLSGDLRALGVRWALVGGMAVSFRAEPRTTQDVDVTIAVSGDQEAERIARDLTMRGYRPLESQPFLENLDGRLNAVRLLAPTAVGLETIGVDLLFGSSGVEAEVVAAAEVREVAIGLYVPVARIGHLIALRCWPVVTRIGPMYGLCSRRRLWRICSWPGRASTESRGRGFIAARTSRPSSLGC